MKGVDYAFRDNIAYPRTDALRTAGVGFVGRYTSMPLSSDTNGKNLIPAEKIRLLSAGISIIIYAEETAGYMKGGWAAGVALAGHAVAVLDALGMPTVPIYYAADWDVSDAEQAAVHACLDGTASVHGVGRNGIYGGYHAVRKALDAGKARYACQTYAWSSTTKDYPTPAGADKVEIGNGYYLYDKRAQVRQSVIVRVDGVECDLLESRAADFGQWPRPPAPPVIQEEEHMGQQLTNEAYETFPAGKYHKLHLFRDFVTTASPVVLRIAIHSEASSYQLIESYTISDSSPHTINFAKADVSGVSIVRKSGPSPIGYSFS